MWNTHIASVYGFENKETQTFFSKRGGQLTQNRLDNLIKEKAKKSILKSKEALRDKGFKQAIRVYIL